MQRTMLYDLHVALNAKIVPFAGFEMPVQYSSIKEEVLAVRNGVGMFDVSHMGEFFIKGSDAARFVDYLLTNDIAKAPANKAIYSPLCRENGTIVDDMIAYKISNEKVLICVNASNIEKDWKHFNQYVREFNCTLSNRSQDYSLLAVQGPKTEALLGQLKFGMNLADLGYYSVFETSLNGTPIILARTGYTGEDGFEVFGDHQTIRQLWSELLRLGVSPCGLAARDVLRMEAAFPLYGHEIHDDVTPLDSNLKWTVKNSKERFVGKTALATYRPQYKLVKMVIEGGIPRQGHLIQLESKESVGQVVSGTLSPILNKGIAIAHIKSDFDPTGKKLFINIREKHYEATLLNKAFVQGSHK